MVVDSLTKNVYVLYLSARNGVPEHKRPQVGPAVNS